MGGDICRVSGKDSNAFFFQQYEEEKFATLGEKLSRALRQVAVHCGVGHVTASVTPSDNASTAPAVSPVPPPPAPLTRRPSTGPVSRPSSISGRARGQGREETTVVF